MPDGGFLVSMMGSASGGSPGRLARYNKSLQLVGEYPEDVTGLTGLNPHGFGIDFARGAMLSMDYVEPASTLVGNSIAFRSTARLWDLASMTITHTYTIKDGNGPMDAAAIGDTGSFYFTSGNGYLYHIDPTSGNATVPEIVADLGTRAPVTAILQPFRGGQRLLIAVFSLSRVLLFDTSAPRKPKLLDTYQFPEGTGSHLIRITADESLALMTTYFLDEGTAGQVHFPGDLTVRMLRLSPHGTRFARDAWPQPGGPTLNFTSVLPGKGAFRPHGIALL